ncbi:2Fe-2S iron-sulfur cluster protein [Paraburkholderia sp. BL6665CI2N2]|uniref:(2Fe-2S)-binding protein n=1 Tax=Paraburkholderia sp. BL6665CI2N2 TaxID=1938806 RepID=UPI001066EEFD|nr:(2Fe-2S)-binding protein [Paraburkholderia sp. BL6665CI2N2]TDY26505.1 2Fe-2S iron-sulfur cluster protein [Paraburkholderia sp. BL6665CI2N2]
MTTQSTHTLFKPLSGAQGSAATHVAIWFNGRPLSVPGGCSVAAALLAAGVSRFRATPVSGAARAPFCMMGACFDCLVEIDGMPSRQACMVEVKAGMRIRSQEGARDLPPLGATAPADAPLENAHER